MRRLQEIRQGDISYDERSFVYRSAPDADGNNLVEEEVEGIAVLTQTCDIVRSYEERPYLEVCPLVSINDQQMMDDIRKGRRPRYAFIPAAASHLFAADLDRVMTVDKALALEWEFEKGCFSAMEQKRFAQAIARKRSRFAFPDNFVEFIRPLQTRIVKKHSKESSEGDALRRLDEIRIMATPSWEESKISLTFYFIVLDGYSITTDLEEQCNIWIDVLQKNSIYISIDAITTSLIEISAWEYVNSIPLDLDYLS